MQPTCTRTDFKYIKIVKKGYGISPDFIIDNPKEDFHQLLDEDGNMITNEKNANFCILTYLSSSPEDNKYYESYKKLFNSANLNRYEKCFKESYLRNHPEYL